MSQRSFLKMHRFKKMLIIWLFLMGIWGVVLQE